MSPAAAVAWCGLYRTGFSPAAFHAFGEEPLTRLPPRGSQPFMPFAARTRAPARRASDLLDLPVFEFHRRRTTEDRHLDLEAGTLFVDFLHGSVERRERTVGHTDLLADFEGD